MLSDARGKQGAMPSPQIDGGLAVGDVNAMAESPALAGAGGATAAQSSKLSGWAAVIYWVLAWVLVGCITVQVFLAGMAVFVFPADWSRHVNFVHTFEFLPILLFLLSWVGKAPWRLRLMTIGIFALIELQYVFINLSRTLDVQEIAALHPVNALVIFGVAIMVARRAGALRRGRPEGRRVSRTRRTGR